MCILQVILFKTYCVILCHVYTIINQVDNQCACENKIWKNKAYNRKQRKTKQINCHCHHCQSSRKSVWSVDIRKRLIWTTISQLISHIGVVLQLTFLPLDRMANIFPFQDHVVWTWSMCSWFLNRFIVLVFRVVRSSVTAKCVPLRICRLLMTRSLASLWQKHMSIVGRRCVAFGESVAMWANSMSDWPTAGIFNTSLTERTAAALASAKSG